jgi:hypothetical protein
MKLFIHIPKNAGMTIRRSAVLKGKIMVAERGNHTSLEYSDTLKRTMDKSKDHHGYEHARWRDWRADLREKHTAFAVVRNPWSRVVSRYFFAKLVIENTGNVPASYADVSSFEAFLEERHKWGGKKYYWHRAIRGWYPALDHVTDKNGKIRCDIIRFDRLNPDLCRYFNLGSMTGARNVTRMNKGNYQSVYTDKTQQIVADWYAKDIDTWGFDFDTGATRNCLYS